MPGSTELDGDCRDAFARLEELVHGQRTVVEGDEHSCQLMVNQKSSAPWKCHCILPIPGGGFESLTAGILSGGIERVHRQCGADDSHVALARYYRLNHHWLSIMDAAFWSFVCEC